MIPFTLSLLWLALGTTSLVFTLATDEPPLTPRKVALAYTLGPAAIAIGAVAIALAALRKAP
jgi:hypothetical protein